ncbi:MFS transporter [Oceanospirillum maris]|uniref:MFS transporter n=1 Tax=Oceanospirillum maris TaxID=64977 RepID=UPI0003FEAE9B|nr:MFS transporter [Oceanospirillum maris]
MQALIILIASAGAFFNLYQLQSLYPQLHLLFAVSEAQAGPLNMATLLSLALMALFSGALMGRIRGYTLICAAFLLMALANLALALVSEQWPLLAVRMFQGILIPLILSTLLRASGKRPAVISAYVTGTILGSVASRFGTAWLVDHLGWQNGFICSAAAMMIVLIIIRQHEGLFRDESDTTAALPSNTTTRVSGWHQLSESTRFRLKTLLGIGFCILFSQSSLYTAIGLRLAGEFGLSASDSGLIYLTAVLAIFFPPLALSLAYRFGRGTSLLLVCSLSALSVLASLLSDLWLIALSVAVFSVAAYMAQSLANYGIADLPAGSIRYANGIYLFFYYIGGCCGALSSAFIYSHYGWSYVVLSIISIQFLAVLYGIGRGVSEQKKERITKGECRESEADTSFRKS